jgi:peptide/nickel transport system substrate-binding protein
MDSWSLGADDLALASTSALRGGSDQMTRTTRRAALKVLGSGAGVFLLAACGPTSQPAAPPVATAPPAAKPTAQPTTPAAPAAGASTPVATLAATAAPAAVPQVQAKPGAGQPKTGGMLRMGVPTDIVTLDGVVRGGAPYESVWLMYDRLITYDDKLKPMPMLAESWDVTPDYNQVQLNLRKGVTWHTGREFTSDDVKWNLLRVQDPKAGYGDFAAQSSWFTTIDTPDKNTVILKSEQSRPSMFDFLQQFNLVDRTIMEGPDAKTKASGTGPFTFVEWVQGERVVIAKNKNYWQTGKPYLDGITASIRAGDQPGLAALEAGTIDLLRTGAIRDVARLKADPSYQVFLHPSSGTFYELAFLTTVQPFDNKLVRQAFNWAIDRQRLVDQVFLGFAQLINVQWSPSSPAYDPAKNKTYTFDLDKAKALLQQAGATNIETEIIVSATNPLNSLGFLQIYQADLSKIGVKLNIKTYDPASWAAAVLGHNYKAMYATGDVVANLLPINNLNGPTWRPNPNNTEWDTPEWKDIWAQVASEADPDKQKTLYARMNDYILDQSWAMPMCTNPQILVGSSKVKGLEPNQYGAWYFTNAWLDT